LADRYRALPASLFRHDFLIARICMRLAVALVVFVVIVYAAARFAGQWAVGALVDEATQQKPVAFPTVSFPPLQFRTFEPFFPTFSLDGDDPEYVAPLH
jgi:hypothetical protein